MDVSEDENARFTRHESSPERSPAPDQRLKLSGERGPKYKSWRKKYRKMKARFEDTMNENVTLYKTEQRLEGIAKRLQEQNDQLLDLLLDLNTSLQLPDSLRINVDLNPSSEERKVTIGEGNDRLFEVHQAIDQRTFPASNLPRIREELEERVANDNAVYLHTLEDAAPEKVRAAGIDALAGTDLVPKINRQLGYMTTVHEGEYLRQIDAKLGDADAMTYLRTKALKAEATSGKDSAERDMELKNPQSVHNWLKTNKISVETPDEKPDNGTDKTPSTAKRGGAKSLSRKIGDKALGRSRERDERSPVNAEYAMDDDMAYLEATSGSGRKRKGRDPDEAYRPKGSGRGKPKRKRDEGEMGTTSGSGRKKTKTSIGPGEN